MFNLVKGVEVKNLEGIHESYEIQETEKFSIIRINVSAEKIGQLFRELCSCVREPAFLVLELPTNANIEKELRKSDTDPFHHDVYYLDGQLYSNLLAIFNKYEELFVNDGFIEFGFGSHQGYDEVFVVDYKIFQIYTNDHEKYMKVLEMFEIQVDERYKTVWDNFSTDTPGSRLSIQIDGFSIYDMIEELQSTGLYFAERRSGG